MNFSPDQVKAIDGICNELLNSNPRSHALAVLTGSAGTGKSTVVLELLNRLEKESPLSNIKLAATTHRAAKVLQDIISIPVSTIHGLFKLRPSNDRYGKETFTSTGPCTIPHGAVIIIDEASMLGNRFITTIVDTIKEKALKILFVGDPFQLPPPTDTCFLFDGSLPTFTLTQVHRQAGGNPILEKANEFREYIEGIRPEEPIIKTSINGKGEGIHVLPHSDFVTQFVRKYSDYDTGAEVDIPLCTYTNESAINYNNMIRKAAYFLTGTVEPFYPGEQLIANSIVMQGGRALLTNNEIVYIKDFHADIRYGIPGYTVTVTGDYSAVTKSRIKTTFVPKTKIAADKVLKTYSDTAKKNKTRAHWAMFYEVKNSLADLRPPFAGTTHKSQGGTFPAVFIDIVNIRKCRDLATRARLMYVALTRASKNVYINA